MKQIELEQTLNQYLQLSSNGVSLLKQHVSYVELDKAAEVIHKGQAVSGAYFVLSGQLRVYTYSPQGNEATLYIIRPGETCVLALNCLFNDLRYPAWVESAPATQVAVIPGSLYRQLFQQEPTIQNITVKNLSTLVFRLMAELEQIHTCNISQRLASFLLNNASKSGQVKMTQQMLADHLGTKREVIARAIQQFTSLGLVSTRRGSITLHNEQGLSEQMISVD